MQKVKALAGRRCGPAVVSIHNRPDEEIDDMLIVLENQSTDDMVVYVIEATADQRKAPRRQVDYRRRGSSLPLNQGLTVCWSDVVTSVRWLANNDRTCPEISSC
jgi:hypothetical protein